MTSLSKAGPIGCTLVFSKPGYVAAQSGREDRNSYAVMRIPTLLDYTRSTLV